MAESTQAAFIHASVDSGIATITIRRPEALNALNEQVVSELEAAFDQASQRPDVRAVVLEGSGKAFIAGADIKFFIEHVEAGTIPKILEFTRRGHRLLRKLETCFKPVIAKVNGLALGGGTELSLACHAIVATEKASFGLPETGIGIYPGLGGTQRTPRAVGKELGKYLIFSGQLVDGKTAHELGLARYFAPSEEVDAYVKELVLSGKIADKFAPRPVPQGWEPVAEAFSDARVADMIAGKAAGDDPRVQQAAKVIPRKAPLAIRFANRVVDEGLRKDLESGLELELSGLMEIFATKDALHGLKSIGAYKPEFKGE
ncbi:MAG: enoyl-CoA hydratase/isomerase family protein [Deltaproteobacteria bacterium]|nr:enoyl-CoA hydratase/isomerase family protein [Deltaproteobacteria bacterium]